MCIRHFWGANLVDLSLDLYRRVLRSISQYLRKIILYGFGEPFINPNFIKMLKIAREILPKDSEIVVSTNGSMLNANLSERVLKIGVDNISFSIDTIDIHKLKRVRKGSEPKMLLENIHFIAKMKKLYKIHSKLGIEVVLMKDNFKDLPSLVERMAKEDVDYIMVSNIIPYTEKMSHEALYVTISKKPLEIVKPILKYGRRAILDAIYEMFSVIYSAEIESSLSRIIDKFWREAEEAGYWINLPLLFESIERVSIIEEIEKIFELSRKIARENGVFLSLPNLYPDAKDRRCPYVDKKAAFIRSDGAIAPCQEFAYKHPVYVNMHTKIVNPVIFGDSKREGIINIWNKKEYAAFREVREKMPENVPWCGDCLYSMFKCFFTETNSMDCFMNKPSCSECLYSANISQCNI